MARLFDDASNQYLSNSSAVLTAAPITLACWFKSDNITAQQALVSIGKTSDRSTFLLYCRGNVAGDPIGALSQQSAASAVANTTTGYSSGTWHHGCAVFASSTSRAAYIDGGSKGTNSTSVIPLSLDVTDIGALNWSSGRLSYFSGDIAEVGIWNVALTDAEVALLAAGLSPLFIQPANLVSYWPIVGRYSPEIDRIGAANMTVTGATTSDHPRIVYPTMMAPWLSGAPAPPVPPPADVPPERTMQILANGRSIEIGLDHRTMKISPNDRTIKV